MIKANELRIGNLVYGALDKIYTVDANIIHICSRNPDWVDPIPLSPEILLKCGLKRNDWFNDINYSIGDFFYITEDFGIYYKYWDGERDLERKFVLFPKYLHQLQNIYFALTGDELIDETQYLLFSESNKKRLLDSLGQADK